MCILFFIATTNPTSDGYKLILASNRDEFYGRPALPASKWTESHPHVFGGQLLTITEGRDMEPGREGGTQSSASILHTSNAPPEACAFPLGEVHGFGNSPYTIPLRKVTHGKEKFQHVVKSAGKHNLVQELMEFLKDDQKYWPDDELTRRAPRKRAKSAGQFKSIVQGARKGAAAGSRNRLLKKAGKQKK
uniref:Uncharacterized protein n=1 Tax=Phlebotomus papatasi TaxID=29031 RepID=A0A1B0D4N0_PHLPP